MENKEVTIEDLIEWELSGMDYEDLADYYWATKMVKYADNPDSLKDMLEYKKGIEDTEIVLDADTIELGKDC